MELFGRRGRTLSNNLYFSAARKCSLAVQSMEWGLLRIGKKEEGRSRIRVGLASDDPEQGFAWLEKKKDFGVDLIVED